MSTEPSSNKRIGYYDYRLDNFHAEVYLSALRGPLADRGFEIAGATALEPEPSATWAAERDLPYYDTIEQLAGEVDYLMVLAPSNPELHLEMCQQAFPLGKQTFVDKTFAPDVATARAIFELADAHDLPIQSTSALRSTPIQEFVKRQDEKPYSVHICSSGSTLEEYGIHPLELAVSCLGHEVQSLMRHKADWGLQLSLTYHDGRIAVIDFLSGTDCPFSATLTDREGSHHFEVDGGHLFVDAAASILDFFEAGESLIDSRETLVIRRLLDLATSANDSHKLIPVSTNSRPLAAPHWKTTPQTASQREN